MLNTPKRLAPLHRRLNPGHDNDGSIRGADSRLPLRDGRTSCWPFTMPGSILHPSGPAARLTSPYNLTLPQIQALSSGRSARPVRPALTVLSRVGTVRRQTRLNQTSRHSLTSPRAVASRRPSTSRLPVLFSPAMPIVSTPEHAAWRRTPTTRHIYGWTASPSYSFGLTGY